MFYGFGQNGASSFMFSSMGNRNCEVYMFRFFLYLLHQRGFCCSASFYLGFNSASFSFSLLFIWSFITHPTCSPAVGCIRNSKPHPPLFSLFVSFIIPPSRFCSVHTSHSHLLLNIQQVNVKQRQKSPRESFPHLSEVLKLYIIQCSFVKH